MLRCPVFHVNGEDPEAVAQVVESVDGISAALGRDVVIDLYCYRRYGHNEADEPRFTQPVMYAAVDKKPSVREVYIQRLVEGGKFTRGPGRSSSKPRAVACSTKSSKRFARRGPFEPPQYSMAGVWAGYKGGPDNQTPDVATAVPKERLKELLDARDRTCRPTSTCTRSCSACSIERREQRDGDKPLDWGTAETLAYATLLTKARACVCRDRTRAAARSAIATPCCTTLKTGKPYTPLAHIAKNQARFEVWDSPLTEAGVLGFEYGYSLDYPDGLVVWEAQFGDFANGAQVIIDQFIVSSEDKWHRLSGLALLLPHGFEGQGPEHSQRAPRALPDAVRRRQHAGLQPDHARAVLPRAAPAGACAAIASRSSSCRRRACCVARGGVELAMSSPTVRSSASSPTSRTSIPKQVKRVLLVLRQGLLRPRARAHRAQAR